MADPFLAEVRIFGFNFPPTGWAQCNGQILPISQNPALFSLLGVQYGGNGTSNFALPNLQDSFVVGSGNGAGLTPYIPGESGGTASVALQASQMPGHVHALQAGASPATGSPTGAALAPSGNGSPVYHAAGTNVAMSASALTATGQGQPHENRQPALALNFCIAMVGIFPPRA